MSKVITIELGNVYSRIPDGMHHETIAAVKDICSYTQQTFNIKAGGKSEMMVSLFNEHKRTFPTGLHQRVGGILEQMGYKVKIKDLRDTPDRDIDKIMGELLKKADKFGLALRDYQIEGVMAGIENQSGLFDWSTGAGKTVLFVFLLTAYDTPTLILVNRKELMEQIASEISSMTKSTVGMIGDGIWNPSKWTVAIVDTLNKHLNSPEIGKQSRARNFLAKTKMFVGDEVHHLGARTWKEIAKACMNAPIRYGFSGTCFHPDSEDVYLVGFTGEVISSVKYKDLVPAGWLANLDIYMPRIKPNEDLMQRRASIRNWHDTKKYMIRENDAVTDNGVDFLYKMYKKNITGIFFAGDDVQYGSKIAGKLIEAGVHPRQVRYMSGREPSEVRRKTLADFKEKKFMILGGTSIYDEGVDVPHTGAGANFGQGFSEIKTIQRIGRVLRKTKQPGAIDVDPNEFQKKYYWDGYNLGNGITEKHSAFREGIYEEQDAFKVFKHGYKTNKGK